VEQVEVLLTEAGVPADVANQVSLEYVNAELEALKISLFAVGVFAVLGLWFTRRLPNHSLAGPDDVPETAAVPV